MMMRRPLWLGRVTAPGAQAFALMAGLEGLCRSVIAAAIPIQTQALFGNDESVSLLSLVGAVASLVLALSLPAIASRIRRARLCMIGIAMIAAAGGVFMLAMPETQVFGFIFRACGAVTVYSTVSMYIMDHVRRDQIGRSEPMRMLSIGIAWTIGPTAGVWLETLYGPWAPFLASVVVSVLLLSVFLKLRFGPSATLQAAKSKPEPISWRHAGAFLRQPRLLLAWLQACGRGVFWVTFFVYGPLYVVQAGLGPQAGGYLVSAGSAFMLAMPVWGWLARRFGIRRLSLACFPLAAAGMATAGFVTDAPLIAVGGIVTAALGMSMIDGYGNALFLRACKPSQRTRLSPVFSTHRDVTELGQAAVYAVILWFLPVQAVFVFAAVVLMALTVLSLRINRRL